MLRNCSPVLASHTRAVPSSLAVAIREPSRLTATSRTWSLWPQRDRKCVPASASQSSATALFPAVTIVMPSGLSVTAFNLLPAPTEYERSESPDGTRQKRILPSSPAAASSEPLGANATAVPIRSVPDLGCRVGACRDDPTTIRAEDGSADRGAVSRKAQQLPPCHSVPHAARHVPGSGEETLT